MDAGARRPPESLRGPGLVLARWREPDLAELQAAVAANREHLSPWMTWGGDSSQATVAGFLSRTSSQWERGETFEYAVRSPRGVLLGGAGLMARLGPGALEVGYWVDARHTRRRTATRAAALLTAVAFTLPRIERVEIHHDEANAASAGVPALLGFRRVGTFPGPPVGAPAETGREVRWRMEAREFPGSAAARPDESL